MDNKNITDEVAEKKILIVDDDPVALEMLEKILLLEGYWVGKATNGKEALYIADELNPDLIILDIVMPVLDRTETIEKLEKNPKIKNIPLLFLTSTPSKEEEFENYNQNRHFLARPIEKEKLIEEVVSCIGGSKTFKW